jgi:hypothetical protein
VYGFFGHVFAEVLSEGNQSLEGNQFEQIAFQILTTFQAKSSVKKTDRQPTLIVAASNGQTATIGTRIAILRIGELPDHSHKLVH